MSDSKESCLRLLAARPNRKVIQKEREQFPRLIRR